MFFSLLYLVCARIQRYMWIFAGKKMPRKYFDEISLIHNTKRWQPCVRKYFFFFTFQQFVKLPISFYNRILKDSFFLLVFNYVVFVDFYERSFCWQFCNFVYSHIMCTCTWCNQMHVSIKFDGQFCQVILTKVDANYIVHVLLSVIYNILIICTYLLSKLCPVTMTSIQDGCHEQT
jgi:hypothetical protein